MAAGDQPDIQVNARAVKRELILPRDKLRTAAGECELNQGSKLSG
jgi:hypothetical protein